MKNVTLPDPGEGLLEADVTRWLVEPGQQVAVNDPIVEIETAKSLVELPSPYAGVVGRLLVAEGETARVGATIMTVLEPGELDAEVLDAEGSGAEGSGAEGLGAEGSGAVLVGYGVGATAQVRRPKAARVATEPQEDRSAGDRVLAAPVVRRLARDLGVDLHDVEGSGPEGLVTPGDVADAAGGGNGRRNRVSTHIPLRGVRRQMMQSMAASIETPQASIWLDVDVTRTVELVHSLRERREFADLKISPMLVIAKAVCLALARHPEINSTLHLERDEISVHPDVNLGIAAATRRGLVVPNIKRAQELNLLELALALSDLVAKAREGRITPTDCAGGTFTITNVGVFGVEGGTPILNPGESAILCLGAINRRPWVVGTGEEERLEPRSVATLSLTIDHRVLDGEQGSRFLADVATIVADPGLALLF